MVRYNCSILSNSEAVQLTWRVTLPGSMAINITYHDISFNNSRLNSTIVETALLKYVEDEYIESVLTLTVPVDLVANQTIVECFITDLGYDSTVIFVNISSRPIAMIMYAFHFNNIEPLAPTDFNYTSEYHQFMNTTLTLDWNAPLGSGPQAVVDSYTLSISPAPPSHPGTIVVQKPPFNVTLAHNIAYSLNLTAVNCAGESETLIFPDIEYSEWE